MSNNPAEFSAAENMTAFVPTQYELRVVAKHWHRQLLGAPFYTWATGRFTREEAELYTQLWDLAMDRIDAINRALDPDVAEDLNAEVDAEFGRTYGAAWEAFNGLEDDPRDQSERVLIAGFAIPPRDVLVDPVALAEAEALLQESRRRSS